MLESNGVRSCFHGWRRALAVLSVAALALLLSLRAASQENAITEWGLASVPLRPQWHESWCWAAVTEMVTAAMEPQRGLTQCDVATKDWGNDILASSILIEMCPSTCVACGGVVPTGGTAEACLRGGVPLLEAFGYTMESTPESRQRQPGAALGWPELTSQLCVDGNCEPRPMIAGWRWKSEHGEEPGIGHFVTVAGCLRWEGEPYVILLDPLPACVGRVTLMQHSEFVGGRFAPDPPDDQFVPDTNDHVTWMSIWNIQAPAQQELAP